MGDSEPVQISRMKPSPAELKENLRRQNLKWNWDAIASDCVANPKLLPHLIRHCISEEVQIQQNAGAVLGKLINLDKEILVPHIPSMLKNLQSDPHDAVKRATMRVLERIEIPEKLEGDVYDVAMQFVTDFNQPVAIRAFSMTVARRICQSYPSLSLELLPVVQGFFELKQSAGIIARARKELKILEKLKGKAGEEDSEGKLGAFGW